jgi:L-ascorbate metabolism protein UlaG (beta-lactamase superfamily)
MKIRWLGWAGVEIEEQGEHIVIDPLRTRPQCSRGPEWRQRR